MWYDIDKSCSYNQLFNFIVGPRGYGKTYSWKKKAIRDFIKKGKQFVYLRRYESELDLTKNTLFDDIILNQEFPGYDIELKPEGWVVNGEIAGYPMALSLARQYKSSSYPQVYNICFDEFIIDGGKSTYLKAETTQFLSFYSTIARLREDVIVFFMANAITMANPYFLKWDLTLPKDKDYVVKNNMLLQFVYADEDFKNRKAATRFGEIEQFDGYATYSVENKLLLDDEYFIKSKDKGSQYLFTFIWHGKDYGVYDNTWGSGGVIISYDIDKCYPLKFTLDKGSMNESLQFVKTISNHYYFGRLKKAFMGGSLYYENMKIKLELREMLELVI